jgi:hypothetical protein
MPSPESSFRTLRPAPGTYAFYSRDHRLGRECDVTCSAGRESREHRLEKSRGGPGGLQQRYAPPLVMIASGAPRRRVPVCLERAEPRSRAGWRSPRPAALSSSRVGYASPRMSAEAAPLHIGSATRLTRRLCARVLPSGSLTGTGFWHPTGSCSHATPPPSEGCPLGLDARPGSRRASKCLRASNAQAP